MEIISEPRAMQARAIALAEAGRRIALVPTMGALHAGHLSLLEAAREHGDVVALSIFVNPTQFGPREDLARYPRDIDGDLAQARGVGVNLVFTPEPAMMYPQHFQTFVEVRQLQRGLCGERRPGHFVGVATVVLKLFHLLKPRAALFGEKDFQQLQLIRRMVEDLNLDVAVIGMPIVREPDGLAMSSRNVYLTKEERDRALCLRLALESARRAFLGGERRGSELERVAALVLTSTAGVAVDYVELREVETLERVPGSVTRRAVLAVAVVIGSTRLIDNVQLDPTS